jgi:excisionase family DNA binding protein
MKKPLRIKDLAEELGVTRQTIHNMLRDGRLPVNPIPGTKPRLFPRDQFEMWLTASKNEAV